jgi:hypothetical protein
MSGRFLRQEEWYHGAEVSSLLCQFGIKEFFYNFWGSPDTALYAVSKLFNHERRNLK